MSRLDVEVLGDDLPAEQVRRACVLAAATAGVEDGHVAVDVRHAGGDRGAQRASTAARTGRPTCSRSRSTATARSSATRELGDVVICPEHTVDLDEAVVHGVLHLVGMDHETDEGEMLALQAEVVSWIR